MTDAGYFRDWRRAHPEYKVQQNARRNERRRRLGRGNRAMEYARRSTRALPPMPSLHSGHPLFDQARAIVGPNRSGLTVLRDPLYDDLIAVATLAILQGRDPAEAVRRFRSAELAWRRVTCSLIPEAVAA
jgi:hypothetical protein